MSDMSLNNDDSAEISDDNVDNKSVLIGLCLPSGEKKQKWFSNGEKLKTVMEFALSCHYDDFESTLEFKFLIMPNFIIHDLNKTIRFYNIENRSMLFVIENSSIC